MLESLFIVFGALFFGIGICGFLARRNLLVVLLSAEITLVGASMNFIGFSLARDDIGGQVFVIFIITLAAAEMAVGLAILSRLYARRRSINSRDWMKLKG